MASDAERYYDEEIAPKLAAISRDCHAKGLSFLAVVEWEPGASGRTTHFVDPYGLGIGLANAAAIANGNVDLLMMHIQTHAEKHGHGSVYLHRLGISYSPDDSATQSGAAHPRKSRSNSGE